MATLDDSPSLFSGKPWTIYAENVEEEQQSKNEEEKKGNTVHESDSMKLRKQDMGLYGLCPARDEFYLVVCEKCGHVVKPQALKTHIALRHCKPAPGDDSSQGTHGAGHHTDDSQHHASLANAHLPSSARSSTSSLPKSDMHGKSPHLVTTSTALQKTNGGSGGGASHMAVATARERQQLVYNINHTVPVVKVERLHEPPIVKKIDGSSESKIVAGANKNGLSNDQRRKSALERTSSSAAAPVVSSVASSASASVVFPVTAEHSLVNSLHSKPSVSVSKSTSDVTLDSKVILTSASTKSLSSSSSSSTSVRLDLVMTSAKIGALSQKGSSSIASKSSNHLAPVVPTSECKSISSGSSSSSSSSINSSSSITKTSAQASSSVPRTSLTNAGSSTSSKPHTGTGTTSKTTTPGSGSRSKTPPTSSTGGMSRAVGSSSVSASISKGGGVGSSVGPVPPHGGAGSTVSSTAALACVGNSSGSGCKLTVQPIITTKTSAASPVISKAATFNTATNPALKTALTPSSVSSSSSSSSLNKTPAPGSNLKSPASTAAKSAANPNAKASGSASARTPSSLSAKVTSTAAGAAVASAKTTSMTSGTSSPRSGATSPRNGATSPRNGSSNSGKKPVKKFLPCKDREFDADTHCGVWISELSRQCTRSLTCKTHALSLRRAVKGRRKSFDDLLKEHRAAKEALLKAKADEVAAAAALAPPSQTAQTATKSITSPTPAKTPPSTPTTYAAKPCVPALPPAPVPDPAARPSASTLHYKVPQATTAVPTGNKVAKRPAKLIPSPHIPRPSVLPIFPSSASVGLLPLPDCSSCSDSDDSEDDEEDMVTDLPYLTHQPRPLAVNAFRGWQHGRGCYVFNRKEDLLRSALVAAVERHLHPPPHKKLCVESKLPQGSFMETDSKDPYEFTIGGMMGLKPGSATNHLGNTVAGHKLLSPKSKAGSKSIPASTPVITPKAKDCGLAVGCGAKSPVHTVPITSLASYPKVAAAAAAAVAAAAAGPGSSTLSGSGSGSSFSSGGLLSGAKRKRSGSSPGPGIGVSNNAVIGSTTGVSSTAAGTTSQSNPLSVTIPTVSINLNLSSTTLTNINAALTAVSKPQQQQQQQQQLQLGKNNFLKDLNFVVTNRDSGNMQLNGQLVSLPGGGSLDMTNLQVNSLPTAHISGPAAADKCAKAKAIATGKVLPPGGRAGGRTHTNFTGLSAATAGVGVSAFLTALPGPNHSVIMETGKVAATSDVASLPVAMASSGFSNSNSTMSTPLPSPCTTPSPQVNDCTSPQVCEPSPLANGLISSHHVSSIAAAKGGGANSANHVVTAACLSSSSIGALSSASASSLDSVAALSGLPEQLLAQASGAAFTLTTGSKADSLCSNSSQLTLGTGVRQPVSLVSGGQVALSATTAQQLAAAALNLTTHPGCLLNTNSVPQLYPAALSSLGPIQIQTKAGPTGRVMQPVSLTFVPTPGVATGVAQPAQPSTGLVFQQSDPTRHNKDLAHAASSSNVLT